MADIQVVVVEQDDSKSIPTTTTRGGRGGATLSGNTRSSGSKIKQITTKISSETLAKSMKELKGNLDEVFASIEAVGNFELSEVKLGLEITAKGGVSLIGSAEAGAKGAITLTFSPPKKSQDT